MLFSGSSWQYERPPLLQTSPVRLTGSGLLYSWHYIQYSCRRNASLRRRGGGALRPPIPCFQFLEAVVHPSDFDSSAGAPAPGPLMFDIAGLSLDAEDRELLKDPLIGGLIFFARNYQSREQLAELVASIRQLRPDILLAVDQEGGRVQRFRDGFTRLPPMQSFLPHYQRDAAGTLQAVRDVGWLMAAELLAVDVDFSFAPVLDVDDSHCSVIADRAFSNKPEEVVAIAEAFIDGMHEAGMATTGKHFPGHGAVTGDSHLLLPVDQRSWEDIAARDWIPFRELAAKLDGVMPAHIVFEQVDAQPVGFSSLWLQQKLRGELAYQGVIFSDDLSMEGAAIGGTYGERAQLAMKAGCDMVLVCNHRAGALEVLESLRQLAPAPSDRLSRMRARKRWNQQELESSARWQSTRAWLSGILA